MNKLLVAGVSVILFTFSPACGEKSDTSEGQWKIVGTRCFSDGTAYYVSIDVDGSGMPVLGYRDEAYGGKLTVVRWDGSAWQVLGEKGFTPGGVTDVCIDEYGGVIYAAYRDEDASDKVSVQEYSGSWSYVGSQGFSANPVSWDYITYQSRTLSLRVINSDAVYVAYITTDYNGPLVYKWDGSDWSDISPLSAFKTYEVSIHGLSSSAVYLAYSRSHNGYVSIYDGNAWSAAGANDGLFTVQGGCYLSLVVRDDIPYVAYSAIDGDIDTGGSDKTPPDRVVLKAYSGSSWDMVGDIISPDTGTEVSLCFDDVSAMPVVCYMDWSGVGAPSVQRYTGTAWESLGTGIIDTGTHYIDTAVYNSTPFVAFTENDPEAGDEGMLTVMKYEP